MVSADSKYCVKCKKDKSLSQFHQKGKGILRNDCNSCVREYGKTYRSLNKALICEKKKEYHRANPHVKRKSHLKKEFNMTIEDYNEMLAYQNNSCMICKIDKVGNNQHKHLHIDHDHNTGVVRGLLCASCNTMLGHAKDNIEILKNAINYLNGVCGL